MKLHKAAKLTPIEVPAAPGCEGLTPETPSTSTVGSNEGLLNDVPQGNQQGQKQGPPPFQFCIMQDQPSSSARTFYFYLNEPAFFSEVMQMTNLLSTATPADKVYINIGSVVSQNAARLLLSMLQTCPAKKIADAPFLSNIYAASILTACDEIITSPFMNAIFDYPQISAGGGIGDAEEALKFNKAEFEATLNLLIKSGIITEEEGIHLHSQNLCVISSAQLLDRYQKYNASKLQK